MSAAFPRTLLQRSDCIRRTASAGIAPRGDNGPAGPRTRRIFSWIAADDRAQVSARSVASFETQQQAQVIHFQQIGRLLRIAAAQRLLQFLEEDFTSQLMAKQFRLQRQPRPVCEHRVSGTQHRFIQKRNDRKNHLLHILGIAPSTARFLFGDTQRLAHLRAERFRILHRLPVVAQSHHGGEYFLKSQGDVPAAPVHGGTRSAIASQRRNLCG